MIILHQNENHSLEISGLKKTLLPSSWICRMKKKSKNKKVNSKNRNVFFELSKKNCVIQKTQKSNNTFFSLFWSKKQNKK